MKKLIFLILLLLPLPSFGGFWERNNYAPAMDDDDPEWENCGPGGYHWYVWGNPEPFYFGELPDGFDRSLHALTFWWWIYKRFERVRNYFLLHGVEVAWDALEHWNEPNNNAWHWTYTMVVYPENVERIEDWRGRVIYTNAELIKKLQ